MAVLGSLAVAVVGDIGKLKQAFGAVKKEGRALGKEVEKSGLSFQQAARYATMAGAAIVGTMAATAISIANTADAIDILSKRTGISREELQALDYAAQQEGTSLEALATGIARLSRNMYDASKGIGEAQRAFADLGIEVTDANGNLRDAGEVLRELADKMAGMTNETEMQALAMQVLGRSGAQMVPFLKLGGDEIARLMQEARDLGHVIEEDAVISLEKFNDSIFAVRTGFAGFGRQMAGDVAPMFKTFSDALVNILKVIHSIPDPIRKIITQGTLLVGTFALVGGGILMLIPKIKALAASLGALSSAFTPFLVGSAIVIGVGILADELDRMYRKADLITLAANNFTKLNDAKAAIEATNKELERLRKELEGAERLAKHGNIFGIIPADAARRVDLLKADIRIQERRLAGLYEQLRKLEAEAAKTPEQKAAEQILANLREGLDLAEAEAKAFGDTTGLNTTKAKLYEAAIKSLVKEGLDPHNTAMGNLVAKYRQYTKAADDATAKAELEKQSLDLLNQAQQQHIEWAGRDLSALEKLGLQLEVQALLDEKHKDALLAAAEALYRLDKEQKEAAKRQEDEAKAKENNQTATELLAEAQKKYAEMLGQTVPEWEEFARQLDDAAAADGVIPETAEALRQLAAQIRQAGAEADAALTPWEAWNKGLAEATDDMGDWAGHMENMARDTAEAMQTAFSDSFFSAWKGELDSLGDYFNSFVDSVLRSMANALSGMFTNFLFQQAFPGMGIPAMAGGGSAIAGRAYLVGERGPELFVPITSGTVVPNDKIAAAPQVVVQNINQTGLPIRGATSAPKFDGKRWVIRNVLQAVADNTEGARDVLGR